MFLLVVRGKQYDFPGPVVMGIINCTPDSFYAGSRKNARDEVMELADKHIAGGAMIIDLGAASTKPGSHSLEPEEEIARLAGPLSWIREKYPDVLISVDTYQAKVAEFALSHGADIINDISGGQFDPEILDVVAGAGCPYIAMHVMGDVETMHDRYEYEDIARTVVSYFQGKLSLYAEKGINQVIIDPGFGFSKNIKQNFELLDHLGDLSVLDRPILVGLSRKRTIWQTLDISPDEALNGTTVLNTLALTKGASILRVHDAMEATQAIKLVKSLG